MAPSEPERAEAIAEPEPVTIAFGGDVHFEGQLVRALEADPLAVLTPIEAMMADADLAIVNLETAVTRSGTAAPKDFTFRVGPVAFDALRAAGVDVVSLANNHGMDYGLEGLEETIDSAAAANFPIVGIGRNADEAYAPWTSEIHGQRVAVFGATQVLDSALEAEWTATDDSPGLASAKGENRLFVEVEQAAGAHDIVVVFLHWGVEGERCPTPDQQGLADRLIDAGADIVVGAHTHRLQGGGQKGGAYVHYGLGNFVFHNRGGLGSESGVLRVTVRQGTIESSEWVPARLTNGVATELTDEPAAVAMAAWEELRACTDLS